MSNGKGNRPLPPANHRQGNQMAVGEFVPLDKRTVALSLVCVALSMFLTALSQTIIVTVLPRIVAEFGGFEKYT